MHPGILFHALSVGLVNVPALTVVFLQHHQLQSTITRHNNKRNGKPVHVLMAACFLSLQTFFGDSIEHYNNSDVLCDLLGLKYVSANVGPDSAIHTCGSGFKILPNWNSPVNCSHKQAARLCRVRLIVLLVQYQSLAEVAATLLASVQLHPFAPGVILSHLLVDKSVALHQSAVGLLVLCSVYLCSWW